MMTTIGDDMPDLLPPPSSAARQAARDGTGRVLAAYDRLVPHALADLRRQIQALADTTAAAAHDNELQALDNRWRTSNRAAELRSVVNDINQLAGSVAATKPNLRDLQNHRILTKVIDLLENRVIPEVQDGRPGAAVLQKLFDVRYQEARNRLTETVQTLRQFLQNSDGRNTNNVFVHDPSLPENTPTLEQDWNNRAKIIIKVSSSLLKGSTHDIEAAASMAHEGSHAGPNPTADFAYRDRNAHYYLPVDIAVNNAAHYEQAVYDVLLNNLLGRTGPEVTDMRNKQGDLVDVAMALLGSQVSRAWVLAKDLMEQNAPARADVEAVVHPPDPGVQSELTESFFERLHTSIDRLMTLVQTDLRLERWGGAAVEVATTDVRRPTTPRGLPKVESTPIAKIPHNRVSPAYRPAQLAEEILRAIIVWGNEQRRQLWMLLPDQLVAYVRDIARHDRPRLRADLQRYYATF